MKVLKKVFVLILLMLFFITSLTSAKESKAEEIQPTTLMVQTKLLNGRSAPRRKASVESRFDYGDTLQETGQWSKDHQWVEVIGGETGTVWVHIFYVSERDPFQMKNEKHTTVKIRKWPVTGRVVGYVRKGQTVDIIQCVLGWGRTKQGWVDLGYLVEEDF